MSLTLTLLPFAGALLLFFIRSKQAAWLSLGVAIAQLVVSFVALSAFDPKGGVAEYLELEWVPALGVDFTLGYDGISLLLLLLCNLLIPFIILTKTDRESHFYALILMMQAGLNGVFMAQDGLTFYIFWELALIPIWFISAMWGGHDAIKITLKFFVYTFSGSLLMLAALIYVYLQTPGIHSFLLKDWLALSLDPDAQAWVFAFMFLAFAIKMPIFPFHTWQADTYAVAPAQGTMLLSGIMLKMGIYGVIRWLIPIAPEAAQAHLPLVLGLSVFGIVYAAIIAIMQHDLKRIVAWSSVSHVGLIAAGAFLFSNRGLHGSMIQMLSHGINVVGLFLMIDLIEQRIHTRQIGMMGGIAKKAPWLTIFSMIIIMGAVAVPLTNGFIGEFLLLNALFEYGMVWIGIAGLTIIFCAVYMLRMAQFTFFGPLHESCENIHDLNTREFITMGILALLVLFTGIYPQPILDLVSPSVQELIHSVKH